MKSRIIHPPINKSYFLFGPRGTGKSTWLRSFYPQGFIIDLLEDRVFNQLSIHPDQLMDLVPKDYTGPIIIDEVQKIPKLLDEVHRQIEKTKKQFILTGSSARKLRRQGVNLLAGRALTIAFFPLTAKELGRDFHLKEALKFGTLPALLTEPDKQRYLDSYVRTYLREEVMQEGLTRNMAAFGRFLEAASFSQGGVLNISQVARECSVERKVVEDYFSILEDLLIAVRIPVFRKKSKRKLISHSKFYFFDSGVFQTLRPKGPLDIESEMFGPALETLVLNELRAINEHYLLGYDIFFWRTDKKVEVDFVLYGKKGLFAFEVKLSSKISHHDLTGLQIFKKDYPVAKCFLLYSGKEKMMMDGIEVLPVLDFFENLHQILNP